MITGNESSGCKVGGSDDLIWFEVRCNIPEELCDADRSYEVENIADGEPGSHDWLPDKIEKKGNWFLFDTHFDNDIAVAGSSQNTVQVLCCNLTGAENLDNPSTMLFHIDYWRKQAARKKSDD